jgi:hypothetical protein
MQLSSPVRDILTMLEQFARPGLREPQLFGMFLQHAADAGRQQQLGELAFHGKYLWKLYGNLQKHAIGDEIRDKVEEELTTTLQEFRTMVEDFSSDGAAVFREAVDTRVLVLSGTGLQAIMDIAHDFSWLKNWELEMQARQTGAGE